MRFAFVAAATVATAFAGGAASAQDFGEWYVRADAGTSFRGHVEAHPPFKGDAGWSLSGAAGRSFGPNFRAEAEINYQTASIKGPREGQMRTFGGFANGYYQFNPEGAWRPFLGAGVGVARVKVHRERDAGFAYQLKAGIAHPFSDRVSGELAYRFMQTSNVRVGMGPSAFDCKYHDQALVMGVRYKLGS